MLPAEWVARLFSRFQAVYGNRVATMWAEADPEEVKAAWAQGLSKFEGQDIARALQAMATLSQFSSYPPTLFEFIGLCRDARSTRVVALPPPVPRPRPDDPNVERLRVLGKELTKMRGDGRDWARRIMALHDAGEPLPLISIANAREVLAPSTMPREPGSDDA